MPPATVSATGSFTALVNDVRLACKRIATLIGKGQLANALGDAGSSQRAGRSADEARRDGERYFRAHQRVGRPARRHALRGAGDALSDSGGVSARQISAAVRSARRLLQHRRERLGRQHLFRAALSRRVSASRREKDFLQPGATQVCAGYAIYGPPTMLVLTTGCGVNGFTLDREIGEFMLTHPNLRIAEETSEFAINASNSRYWEPAIKRYVNECLAGQERAPGAGLQHALDRLAGGRDASHPDARRRVHVSA